MHKDPPIPSLNGNQAADSIPPIIAPCQKPSSLRPILSVLLSLCLGLFLTDGIISLIDDSFNLLWGGHPLSLIRVIVCLISSVLVIVVYGLMGLTPLIPKRFFLPLALFYLVSQLIVLLLMIYFYNRLPLIVWLTSAGQVILGLGMLYWLIGSLKPRWPLVNGNQLGTKKLSWVNLTFFLLLNIFALLPAVVGYLGFCTVLAVGHFSDGFMARYAEKFKSRSGNG